MLFGFDSGFSRPQEWWLKPVKYPKKSQDNFSSKVMLPMSVLSELTIMNLPLPYVFEITHENKILRTNCTVGNFMDYEGEVILPLWMWEHLDLKSSKHAIVSYCRVPPGKKIKLLPHSVEFLEVENPKAELETALRNYGVVTLGDEIRLNFIDFKNMAFTVTSMEPDENGAVYIVDTDLNVEFEAPIGFEEKLKEERTVLKHCELEKEPDSKGVYKFVQKGLTLFTDFGKFDQ